ncbi:VWA domain-containing protein [Pseudaeromonas sharmana]|uniref:VWA domain-containing protein n=1 Tax=Pseudaeromonas sharmana TaxID=328412 RepID=A0ABV8CNQ0_9GAMM
MLTLIWPWALGLLLLPIFVRLLPASVQLARHAVRIPTLPHLSMQGGQRDPGMLMAAWCCWALFTLALSRPVWLDKPVPLERPHRDILLAIDLSDSMRIPDMMQNGRLVNRLTVVKQQLRDFIGQRAGDRMGLILFADHAYLMSPLTPDWQTLQHFVDELDFSMAGSLTSIAEAITLALHRFEVQGSRQKILILLSDGRDTVEGVSPVAAARLAASKGMRIYSIGLGAAVTMVDPITGDQIDPGNDLDEKTLNELAIQTQGQYFRARDPESLASIYHEISALEAVEKSQRHYQPRTELYAWPLLMASLLSLLLMVLYRRRHG